MLTKLARYYLRNDENFKKLDAELDKPEVWQVNDKYTLIHKDGFSSHQKLQKSRQIMLLVN